MEKLNKEEIIKLIDSIRNPKDEWSESFIDELVFKLEENVVCPNPTDLIFYTELSSEEIADKILNYKPIIL